MVGMREDKWAQSRLTINGIIMGMQLGMRQDWRGKLSLKNLTDVCRDILAKTWDDSNLLIQTIIGHWMLESPRMVYLYERKIELISCSLFAPTLVVWQGTTSVIRNLEKEVIGLPKMPTSAVSRPIASVFFIFTNHVLFRGQTWRQMCPIHLPLSFRNQHCLGWRMPAWVRPVSPIMG